MKALRVGEFVFWCEDAIEMARARTLFTKEPGTLAWLQREVKSTDVFWDIGANIGLYTVVAARLGASVVAIEPSPMNAAALVRNVHANGLTERVVVLTVALADEDTWQPFQFVSLRAGASGHQLGAVAGIAYEQKAVLRADKLVEYGVIPPPTLVKLDVDGLEPAILRGMRQTLTQTPPRSLQVEIQPETLKTVPDLLEPLGYRRRERHDTKGGTAKIQAGQDPETVAHNVVFERG